MPSSTVIVEVPPTLQTVRPQKVAVYGRVSSAEKRKHLDRQAQRVAAVSAAKGWQMASVVKDCGSGVNDPRPQFLALLADPTISQIVVEHQDRWGVASSETLLKQDARGRELVSVPEAEKGQGQQALMQDVVALMTSFCARRCGRRRASRKTTQVFAALEVN